MFQDVVNKNFIDNKDKILKKLSIIKKKDNFPITVNLYRIKLIVDYKKIYESIDKLIM